MRQSTAILNDTRVRLWDLYFPASRVQVYRTRLAYIHLDNLLHFAKASRDGRIDGYIVAYLPDEVAMLFLRNGEPVTSVAMTEQGREVLPIPVARQRMHDELERGELAYCEAPLEQLQWMFGSCTLPRRAYPVKGSDPAVLFKALQQESFTGVVELISNGRVAYLRLKRGEFRRGYFSAKDEQTSLSQFMESLFAPGSDGSAPVLAATLFDTPGELQPQADPQRIAKYRALFWAIADAAESQVEGEALKRASKIRDRVLQAPPTLATVSAARKGDPDPVVVTPDELTAGLADWSRALLEELEVIAPGIAPSILKQATHEHRFVLQKAGFYERLPWSVEW